MTTDELNPTFPTIARVHNRLLGGKDNYWSDRDLCEQLVQILPDAAQLARDGRAFLEVSMPALARAGTGTVIDLGCGLPARTNTHEFARNWGARTIYVDKDPMVLAHARALLDTGPDVLVVDADLRNAGPLEDPSVQRFIDWEHPVAIVAVAILEYLPDAAYLLVRRTRGLPPGSTLVLSTLIIPDSDQRQAVSRLLRGATGVQTFLRTPRWVDAAVPKARTSEQPYMASAIIPLRPSQPEPIQTTQLCPRH